MRLALGVPRRVVVVAPHPDDEVIGAWGLMHRLRLAGAIVEVVVASDGAASHPASRAWPPPRLASRRRRESLGALRDLGVSAARVRFYGLPDGRLERCADRLRRELRRSLARAPDLVVGPAETDDHADHRAVAEALRRIAPRARRLAYLVWPAGADGPARTRRSLPLVAPTLRKRFALRRHRSQGGSITDDPRGFAISPAQAAAFTRSREIFLLSGHRR